MNTLTIFIITTLLVYTLYTLYKNTNLPSKLTVSCEISDKNPSCKMYNNRDKSSKCNSLCKLKYQNSVYNNHHSFKNNIHTCECIIPVEKFVDIEDSVKNTPILGDYIPTDTLLTDRNYLENQEYKRLNTLIFG